MQLTSPTFLLISSFAMEVAIVLVLSCFAATSGSTCDLKAPLPKSLPISDLQKIGTWYQTVSSNDYISANYICGTFSKVNVNSESETFTALVTKYYSEAKPRSFDVHDRRTTDGYFEPLHIEYREIPTLISDQYGKWNVKALEEGYRVTINPEKHSFIGDGTHYFAYVQCTPEGWAVWIYTPQKVLATEELLYIRNKLVKNGIHTELRLGNCGDIIPE